MRVISVDTWLKPALRRPSFALATHALVHRLLIGDDEFKSYQSLKACQHASGTCRRG